MLGNIYYCLRELDQEVEAKEKNKIRALYLLMRNSLQEGKSDDVLQAAAKLKKVSPKQRPYFDALEAWALLLKKRWKEAKTLFEKHPIEEESSPLHFAYGAFLYATQGKETAMRHFATVLETPYPQTTALPSHFLLGHIKETWKQEAFWWEKKELYRQIDLFHRCIDHEKTHC